MRYDGVEGKCINLLLPGDGAVLGKTPEGAVAPCLVIMAGGRDVHPRVIMLGIELPERHHLGQVFVLEGHELRGFREIDPGWRGG